MDLIALVSHLPFLTLASKGHIQMGLWSGTFGDCRVSSYFDDPFGGWFIKINPFQVFLETLTQSMIILQLLVSIWVWNRLLLISPAQADTPVKEISALELKHTHPLLKLRKQHFKTRSMCIIGISFCPKYTSVLSWITHKLLAGNPA